MFLSTPWGRCLFWAVLLGFLAIPLRFPTLAAGKEHVMQLSEQDRQTLRELARQSIVAALKGQPRPALQDLSPVLLEPRGAFVTLHLRGQLRGCIGFIEALKPLAETIQEMAVAAAFGDPRFPPLTEQEFRDIDLEISVLSPLYRLKSIDEIEVGVHGLYLRQGARRGLLLPQVATEYNWNRETFLQQTCVKASLPQMAWKDPQTEIYLFSAEVF